MCNIAGYVGSKRAAPILIDMILRQEHFDGGYYTGIATVHEGKIYYAKLTGDTARLLELTDAAALPGTVGLIHSRTKSDGGDKWAHPFVGFGADGTPITAYVANGSAGCFAHRSAEYAALAAELVAGGERLDSRDRVESDRYQTLPDGTAVHMSDLMCALATQRVARGTSAACALRDAFLQMPSEIVGLLLSLAEPDSIAFSRINMPMHAAKAPHGTYLATMAMALPDDAEQAIVLPVCSWGKVTSERIDVYPMEDPPAVIAPIDGQVRRAARTVILSGLAEGEASYNQLRRSIKPCFAPADALQANLLTYEILQELFQKGEISFETIRTSGAAEGLSAPECRIRLRTTDKENRA